MYPRSTAKNNKYTLGREPIFTLESNTLFLALSRGLWCWPTGKYNNRLLFVFPSHNIIVKIVNPVSLYIGLAWSWEHSWAVYKYCVDHMFPAPPPKPHCWYEERAINTYWVWRKGPSVLSKAIAQFSNCSAVLTSSSTSSSSSHLFNIPHERVKGLFFRLSLCLFLSRFLGCLTRSSPPDCLPWKLSDLSGLK
jgi:hypothetical protein